MIKEFFTLRLPSQTKRVCNTPNFCVDSGESESPYNFVFVCQISLQKRLYKFNSLYIGLNYRVVGNILMFPFNRIYFSD